MLNKETTGTVVLVFGMKQSFSGIELRTSHTLPLGYLTSHTLPLGYLGNDGPCPSHDLYMQGMILESRTINVQHAEMMCHMQDLGLHLNVKVSLKRFKVNGKWNITFQNMLRLLTCISTGWTCRHQAFSNLKKFYTATLPQGCF